MGKLVGPRSGQMVHKIQDSQISSRNRVYYQKNGREGLNPVSKMALTNGTRNSVWNIPSGRTGLPFQTFHCYQKFLVERPKKSCAIYFPNGFSGKFW